MDLFGNVLLVVLIIGGIYVVIDLLRHGFSIRRLIHSSVGSIIASIVATLIINPYLAPSGSPKDSNHSTTLSNNKLSSTTTTSAKRPTHKKPYSLVSIISNNKISNSNRVKLKAMALSTVKNHNENNYTGNQKHRLIIEVIESLSNTQKANAIVPHSAISHTISISFKLVDTDNKSTAHAQIIDAESDPYFVENITASSINNAEYEAIKRAFDLFMKQNKTLAFSN